MIWLDSTHSTSPERRANPSIWRMMCETRSVSLRATSRKREFFSMSMFLPDESK